MGTDVSEEPTAIKFRVEEKCMEPAGTSERSVPKHHTTGRYIPEADVKRQTHFMFVSSNHGKML